MEKSWQEKLAERDPVSSLVSMGLGVVTGNCTKKLMEDALENVLPEPQDLKTKVVYGIAITSVSALAGGAVADQTEKAMKEMSGSVLALKASLTELNKFF